MNCQNARQKGSRRDREIVCAVGNYRVLDTDQVVALFFDSMKYGRRKAQERLTKLYRAGRVDRCANGDGPFCYYHTRPGQLSHALGVNWVRIWITKACRSWEKLHSWCYELDYGTVRSDGFAAVKNAVTKDFRFIFVEFDRGTNDFDKVKKYNKLYESGKYMGDWWVKLSKRFPPVLVVTTSRGRAEKIRQLAEGENPAGLEFVVYQLDDMKEEVLKCECKRLSRVL